MPKKYQNIRVFARKALHDKGFALYLVFSGQREFLMRYHYNGLMFT